MPVPLRITLRQVRSSQRLRQEIRDGADTLERLHPRLVSCRVLVEMPHRRHSSGNRFHVRIELKVPGDVIVITHEPMVKGGLPDDGGRLTKAAEADVVARYLYVAIHTAFEAAKRRLQEGVRKQTSKLKAARVRRPKPE